jgi:glutaminase
MRTVVNPSCCKTTVAMFSRRVVKRNSNIIHVVQALCEDSELEVNRAVKTSEHEEGKDDSIVRLQNSILSKETLSNLLNVMIFLFTNM